MRVERALPWVSLTASTSAVVFDPKIDLSLLGPIYLPSANRSFEAWDNAVIQATATLNVIIQTGNSTYGPFDNLGTSFSASVFDLGNNEPLFDFHFEAPQLNGSCTRGKLTDDTIYRTGSLGKLLVMYAWMIDIGDSIFTEPITKYVPELAAAAQSYQNPLLQTNWSEVTVGSLASQISGIGRGEVSLGDLASEGFQQPPVSTNIPNGFPPLGNETVINCSSYGPEPPCTRAQFFTQVINHPPVFLSYTSPSYSNIAYSILGYAYENITGKTINQGQLDFAQKLGMNSTTPTPPGNNVDAIIPRNDSYAMWSYDLNVQDPAGGQYISTRDLITWGQAILNNKLISPVVTRRWMKPTTFTSQWAAAVGAPWEIYRLPTLINTILNTSRIVDTYSKSGDVGQYSTYFGLVPDYNIGITVLAAGDNPNSQVAPVRGTLVDIFYTAAEAAAKQQASNAFTGTFKSTDRNSSITLAVDGGPGVVIKQWISNSTNFLNNEFYAEFNDFRLYPTDLKMWSSEGLTYYKFHMDCLTRNGAPISSDPWSEYNDYWFQLDGLSYNLLAPDAFVVGFDENGIVQSLASQALRTTMVRST
ncbi:putative penicillin-binding protein [Talaromyces proteolyticus]|uniref:Penicillin-binding protein n=1 Tax=Talaromyces proteolyticus TaxID=1131652 RepID=A0AAD4KZE1_9EURO|nr:putative penicillin-binding protein [Talaromyces proteolyticus]KAH8703424.1 putative penicillin-binding protein [Talaromyces proteolyticus]